MLWWEQLKNSHTKKTQGGRHLTTEAKPVRFWHAVGNFGRKVCYYVKTKKHTVRGFATKNHCPCVPDPCTSLSTCSTSASRIAKLLGLGFLPWDSRLNLPNPQEINHAKYMKKGDHKLLLGFKYIVSVESPQICLENLLLQRLNRAKHLKSRWCLASASSHEISRNATCANAELWKKNAKLWLKYH